LLYKRAGEPWVKPGVWRPEIWALVKLVYFSKQLINQANSSFAIDLQYSIGVYTVKGARGKVSFDSQTDKYASQLSSDASPEAYLAFTKMKSVFVVLEVRCDKYASGEA
jgi:hypothetical protein